MASSPLDRIYIRDLQVRCIIGINDDERIEKQDVVINILMEADLRESGRSDQIGDTIDYSIVKKRVVELVESSQDYLIEHLSERIAGLCLEDGRVRRVTVCVDKPGALRFARSVAIEITRERS